MSEESKENIIKIVCQNCRGEGATQDQSHKPGEFDICDVCNGSGEIIAEMKECQECEGIGQDSTVQGYTLPHEAPCRSCGGTGYTWHTVIKKKPCGICVPGGIPGILTDGAGGNKRACPRCKGTGQVDIDT